MNPAVEALKFMPGYITRGVGGSGGWIPYYVNEKKSQFFIQPDDLIRAYCGCMKLPLMGTDDFYRYAKDAGALVAIVYCVAVIVSRVVG